MIIWWTYNLPEKQILIQPKYILSLRLHNMYTNVSKLSLPNCEKKVNVCGPKLFPVGAIRTQYY